MPNEHGTWIMYGVDEHDPYCLKTVDELEAYIDEVGFLPLFKNEIPGFSVEERTVPNYWWSGDREHDPWEWRAIIAEHGNIAYGKFFDKKAGFISKEWMPYFANWRRDGYDFDARWDDEKAQLRQKKIMDLFAGDTSEKGSNVSAHTVTDGSEQDENSEGICIFSNEIKKLAGFGKDGEKNFDGVLTELQMETYLCVQSFKRRRNKAGEEYGWAVAVYTTPENLWGYENITKAYNEDPSQAKERIYKHIRDIYPIAGEKMIHKVIGK